MRHRRLLTHRGESGARPSHHPGPDETVIPPTAPPDPNQLPATQGSLHVPQGVGDLQPDCRCHLVWPTDAFQLLEQPMQRHAKPDALVLVVVAEAQHLHQRRVRGRDRQHRTHLHLPAAPASTRFGPRANGHPVRHRPIGVWQRGRGVLGVSPPGG
jgi:hypothetical protein